jgi:hypothetical protein
VGDLVTPSHWRWGSLVEQQRLAFAPKTEMTDELVTEAQAEMDRVQGQAEREGLNQPDPADDS